MLIKASASHLSNSPRKVNLVAKSIVGLKAESALERLKFTHRRASDAVIKVLKQAIGNAVNNFQMDPKTLKINTAYATKGRTLKRGHFGGRMRYKPYERTASHLTITLTATSSAKPAVAPKVKAETVKTTKVTTKATKKTK